MKQTFKKYFIPHEGNGYHPHILHTKRAIFYSIFFVVIKALVVVFVALLPTQVFVLPEVLTVEQIKLVSLTNELRTKNNLPTLKEQVVLDQSSTLKAEDMATKKYFSHNGPENHNLAYFLGQAGYKYNVAGENLAMGFSSAEEVLNAWVKSPTHLANLMDKDYEEIGVGLETGDYAGESVVYVAEHFGQPIPSVGKVLAEKQVSPVKVDQSNSFVAWEKIEEDVTKLRAEVVVEGGVKTAKVEIGELVIPLKEDLASGKLAGEVTVNKSAARFFEVVTLPVLKIQTPAGKEITENIAWKEILVVSPTPVEKYIRAKSVLAGLTGIFQFSTRVYYGFIGLFALALALKIFIEIRHQHHHIIVQTLALIMLLVVLTLV
ncbi:MAG TPA: CAP domain-containing protein [Patescibacteria group bacterium]|nr:CAP domain-containing protein [Patescibacteria group bacterium]